jgi:uncharacterized membrane-anchored protein
MLWNLLLLVAVGFVAYAVYTYYQTTPGTATVPARIWGSLVAAGAALLAWVAAWSQQGAVPG